MTASPHDGRGDDDLDPDGDPEMLQSSASGSQPDKAEGDDDPSETGSD